MSLSIIFRSSQRMEWIPLLLQHFLRNFAHLNACITAYLCLHDVYIFFGEDRALGGKTQRLPVKIELLS